MQNVFTAIGDFPILLVYVQR